MTTLVSQGPFGRGAACAALPGWPRTARLVSSPIPALSPEAPRAAQGWFSRISAKAACEDRSGRRERSAGPQRLLG